ncbi:MAG: hypothetical protein HY834_09045 [Devosia nanyangense]|uniref:Uncharacterized protein n=1 Tax=Devosia nanyangense TaxID=1228055 RepID=A0A933L2G3_9HYPH|nr:hypothetical protein [Devosia nanyangense]
MLTRPLALTAYHGLKAAFGDLIDLNGSETQAARRTRVDQTTLSRFKRRENTGDPPRFPPVDVVADLEHAAGVPVVTRALADLAHCLLVPLPEGEAGDAVDEHAMRSAQEYADMMAALLGARRDDRITKAEGHHLLRDIRTLMIELAALAEAIKESSAEETR